MLPKVSESIRFANPRAVTLNPSGPKEPYSMQLNSWPLFGTCRQPGAAAGRIFAPWMPAFGGVVVEVVLLE